MAAPRMLDPLTTVLSALGPAGKLQRQGDGWIACCPAHEDARHSLSVGTGGDGRALVTCHAGCSFDAILSALRLTAGDLFPTNAGPRRDAGNLVATYPYHDADGTVLYEVCRYFPKDFKQRVPQQGGGYSWKLGDIPRVWYRLPALMAGLAAGKVAFVCEGEKDADALAALGLTATSLAGGAAFTGSRHWASVAVEHFRGARVVLLPDNDDPGRSHMQRIASRLGPLATWVRTVALPGLPEKGDVSDWLDTGGSVADLKQLVAGTPIAHAAVIDDAPSHEPGSRQYMATAFGNADRFLDAHEHELRHVPQFASWYCWDGQRWAPDASLAVCERAKNVVRDIMKEAMIAPDPEQRKHLARWAAKCQTPGAVESLLEVARSDPRVVRTALMGRRGY